MLYQDEFMQDSQGRDRTIARIRFLYGDTVSVVKGKAAATVTSAPFIGRVLSCTEFETFFGEVIYPDWGGVQNRLDSTSQLLAVESNKASSYFIFQAV